LSEEKIVASKDSLKEQLAHLEEEAATLRKLIAAQEEVAALRAQLAMRECGPVIVPLPYPVYPLPRPISPWNPGWIVSGTVTISTDGVVPVSAPMYRVGDDVYQYS
jgi:hypothetical protein